MTPTVRRESSTSRRALLRAAATVAGTLVAPGCRTAPRGPWEGSPALPVIPPRAGVPRGLEVRGTAFARDGSPFFLNGFNHWSASTLARPDVPGGWDRLRRDLDDLGSIGVNGLRVMVATEGPDSEAMRIVPTLQPSAGRYDPAGLEGVQRLVTELERRDLVAVFVLNNFWVWSGGMAQYLAWAGAGPIPYPPPAPGGSWDRYQRYAARFYTTRAATDAFAGFVRAFVPPLANSRAIVWELANEPRGINNVRAFRRWIWETAALIRSLAPGHLITTGSEGQTASAFFSGNDVIADHQSPDIDFVTCHLWAQNWGWIKKDAIARGFDRALGLARRYVDDHAERAAKLGKPLVLEEFGFPRDGGSFDPGATTTFRDRYFAELYGQVGRLRRTGGIAGIMPWAWAGDARPPRPGALWRPGDPFTGDPPHEEQGWYSVYRDDTTVEVIRAASRELTV